MLRKRLFFHCLIHKNISLSKFARDHGVSPTMISCLLSGHSKSERLRKIIDQFISDNIPAIKNDIDQYRPAA